MYIVHCRVIVDNMCEFEDDGVIDCLTPFWRVLNLMGSPTWAVDIVLDQNHEF